MYTDGFEQWLKVSKNLNTPLTDWSKSAGEVYRHLAEENLEIMNENIARLTDQVKRLSTVKSPEDFLNLQKECLNEDIRAMVKTWQKLTHLEIEGLEEYVKLFGSSMHESSKTMERVREKEREKERD